MSTQRLEALVRLLLDSGDITPMGARLMLAALPVPCSEQRIVSTPGGPYNAEVYHCARIDEGHDVHIDSLGYWWHTGEGGERSPLPEAGDDGE